MSLIVAPGQDVATGDWFSLASLGAGLRRLRHRARRRRRLGRLRHHPGRRSSGRRRSPSASASPGPGPFENIIVDSWTAGYRCFPGQVLASLIQGGTTELGIGRAVVTALLYAGVAAAASLVLVSRRDVTA